MEDIKLNVESVNQHNRSYPTFGGKSDMINSVNIGGTLTKETTVTMENELGRGKMTTPKKLDRRSGNEGTDQATKTMPDRNIEINMYNVSDNKQPSEFVDWGDYDKKVIFFKKSHV